MKAKPYLLSAQGFTPCEASDATHVELNTPGPIPTRMIPIRGQKPSWMWNGDVDQPTLKPSILSRGGGKDVKCCHSFVTNGKIRFLKDCSHELAGKTMDLLEVD